MALVALCAGSALLPGSVFANGYGESSSWQFQSAAQQSTNAQMETLLQEKQGGYFNSFGPAQTTVNTTTNIGTEWNCTLSSAAAGSNGNNTPTALTSSPTVSSSPSLGASTTGNQNTTSVGGNPGVAYALNSMTNPLNGTSTTQGNSGSTLSSLVSGSSNSTSLGPVSTGGGTTNQALNSTQSNSGAQTSSVSGSTACSSSGGK
ncbi:MAG TPA: hypothetical protein VGG53_04735 [Mycobacterium sp.]|uniref:hypothetical protein n=1 Tax=Mycobacterium sp. TaxID=1785 RepID=UPI002F423A0F